MKRFALTLLLAVSALASWAYSFSAVAPSGQTLYYRILTDSTVSVTNPGTTNDFIPWSGYTQPTGALTIPSFVTYSGTTYTVTSIDYRAFEWCEGLASVTIPNSVTQIGERAFKDCFGLTNVIIPNSVTSINFQTFAYCHELTSVTIPNSVTEIGKEAFAYCPGLTSITIPNSVTEIGEGAFAFCPGLTSITIPSSVTQIYREAFAGCTELTSIIVDANNTHYDSRDNCNAIIETASNTLICGCPNTTIPNSVTAIGSFAFGFYTNLTSITIPNSVTEIGYGAFSGSGLTSITIPNSVTEIGHDAFLACDSLRTVTFGNSISYIGMDAFRSCGNLTTITLHATTPPLLGIAAFLDSPCDSILIPCGSWADYQREWGEWAYHLFENYNYSASVATSDSTQGSAAVVFQPRCDNHTAVIAATPAPGHTFSHWSDGSTDNPHLLTVTSDTLLVAYFSLGPTNDTVFIHDTAYVSIPIHDTTIVDNYIHDTAYVFDTVYVSIPIHDTTIVDNYIHDTAYVFDTVYVSIPIHDTTIVNNYIHDTVFIRFDLRTLSVTSADLVRGLAAGNGIFPINSEVEIAAIPIAGNRFVHWQDGNTDNPRTITLTDNMAFTAIFEGTASFNSPLPTDYTISTQGSQVVIAGAANQRIRIFDAVGRLVSTSQSHNDVAVFQAPAMGVYLVQVGDSPAQRVVLR